MGRKIGIGLMIVGLTLLGGALALFCYNRMDAARAGQAAEQTLLELQQAMEEAAPTSDPADVASETDIQSFDAQDATLDTITIDGNEYIGFLSIPSLELELPVLAQWSYPLLKTAPCRYAGAPATDDLIIAAHNYARHFGRLNSLVPGDQVLFTDVNGRVFVYEVEAVDTLEATAVEEMATGNNGLTLFTCTYGGAARVAVRCVKSAPV